MHLVSSLKVMVKLLVAWPIQSTMTGRIAGKVVLDTSVTLLGLTHTQVRTSRLLLLKAIVSLRQLSTLNLSAVGVMLTYNCYAKLLLWLMRNMLSCYRHFPPLKLANVGEILTCSCYTKLLLRNMVSLW